MSQLHWTLLALGLLGGTAAADGGQPAAADYAGEVAVAQGSHRGVAQDYLVLPSGGELSAQMRFLTADPLLGAQPLRFTDVALFGLSGRWSLFSKLELSGHVELLPKQPSYTDEKPWQSVGFGVRSPLGRRVALALSGSGGHLLGHSGMWTRESAMIELRKPIDREFLAFDVQAGVDALGLQAGASSNAFITEVAVQTSALFREPSGHWGAWLGIGYAVPVQASGRDPVTDIAIRPQPRLDFHLGTVLSIVPQWDLYVDFAVIDRGDLSDPATRLPILDGGFDQRQIVFGVTRHVSGPSNAHRDRHDDGDDAVRLGAL